MNKLGAVLIIIAVVALCYVVMLVVIPVVTDLVVTANETMTSDTANVSVYLGAQDLMISSPWILWFVPGTIGIILIVVLLRMPSK